MKSLLSAVFSSLLGLSLTAGATAVPDNVRIAFVQPENFSDFRIQGRLENASAAIFRDQVSSFLSPVVARRFPGDRLALRFTDIDLSGRIDPSKTRQLANVRIDRNVASPLRLYFDYILTDSRGKPIATGTESLVDTDYLYRYNYYSNQTKTQTLFYEKATLSRWIGSLNP